MISISYKFLLTSVIVFLVGLANVCIVTACMTLTRARIEVNIPRKRKGSCSDHDKVRVSVLVCCINAVIIIHLL